MAQDEVLEGLGVTAVNAAQIEDNLLQKAKAVSAEEVRAVKLQRRLKTVGREIRAVKAGLKGLEEAGAVTAAAAVDADPLDKGAAAAEGARQEVAVKPEAPAAPEDGAASAAGSQLQRATMLQRLEALRAKKAQLQEALEEAEAAAEGAASGGPGPQAAPGVVLLEDDPFERELAANDNSSMVETERDRLIRLGVLTPFDRLEGFERRVQSRGQEAAAAGGAAGQSGLGDDEDQDAAAATEAPFNQLAKDYQALKASKPRAQLVHPEELPRLEARARKVDELFWRQATANNVKPRKKRRRQTLAKAKSKPLRVGRPSKKRCRQAGDDDEEGSVYEDTLDGEAGGSDSDASDVASGTFQV
eukprot:jgi/Astpho2/1491/Aster-x1009